MPATGSVPNNDIYVINVNSSFVSNPGSYGTGLNNTLSNADPNDTVGY